jgi:hypothetical protein
VSYRIAIVVYIYILSFSIGLSTGYLWHMEQTKPKIRYCLTSDGDISSINQFLAEHPECRLIERICDFGLARVANYECER